MFEASTVFQRLKSMATLRGMSTKSSSVSETVDGWWTDVASDTNGGMRLMMMMMMMMMLIKQMYSHILEPFTVYVHLCCHQTPGFSPKCV